MYSTVTKAPMPIWGQLFHSMDSTQVEELRISKLSQYVQSMQTK